MASGSVTVDLAQVVEGRKLSFPIHDTRGVLLLAATTVITADHKRHLLARGITRVVMNESDASASATTSSGARVAESEGLDLLQLESKLTERLDSLMRAGMLSVSN